MEAKIYDSYGLDEKEHTGYCSVCGYRKRTLNGYGVCKQCRSKKGY